MREGPDAPNQTWIMLSDEPLPLAEALSWVVEARCGGVVSFTGTVRDHSEGRVGVTSLEYEAYEQGALSALRELAAEARRTWPDLGRIVLHHRVGALAPTETAVAVVVAAPHRSTAFEAARWCIDTLKATVPIWKYERWQDGEDWSSCATSLAASAPSRTGEELSA